ncbi:MAG: hypothetical protein Q8R45_00455 [Brevundimonas sp.]|uniref:hypothetical protein n=1 Tax=Brevundimonas sp. TaxID=1871086 RepID=UPI002720FC6B|nr:hypothetical protein [Brevundimonas sp.]MDO9589068.1 hypothetical protein [Brevundimonas sp.]MDP3655425.1 hypothetical protein [Brevundimonas sp.]MDZ4108731.1 hypothetical protein [Brevundimonas sp.]
MSYGADFANADPANTPLDPVIMIGADPMFWAAILLFILAALFVGLWLGARSNSHRADAAHAIWKAIHDAARSAMGADDNALKGRAEALRKVIDERLGKTLKLAGGLSGRIKKLDDAIAGRGPIQSGGGGQTPPRAGGGHGGDTAQGESGQGGSGGGGGGGGAAAAAAASVTVVTIGGPTTHAPPTSPAAPPTVGDLNHREQTDALRLAVAAFNQHWRDEAARVGELRAAHAELSNPGSGHGSSGHGKASHNGH